MVEAAEFFQRFHLTPFGGLQQRPRLHALASFPLASPDKRTRAAKVAAREKFYTVFRWNAKERPRWGAKTDGRAPLYRRVCSRNMSQSTILRFSP